MSSDMKPGDKIIKVDGVDLTNASHEEAVEAILKAGVHVVFHVQTFVDHPKQIILNSKRCSSFTGGSFMETPPMPQEESEIVKAERKYGHLEGEIHVIDLVKGPAGVGLTLAGNKDRSQQKIFVVGVNPNGAAGIDGRLKVGDQLLEVNHTPLNQPKNHELATNVFKNAKSKLLLVVNRQPHRKLKNPPRNPRSQPTIGNKTP
uniref:PDZ domain-containing protein n=1 Tax=Ciona savignyi TaxID=51511 RepID=H2YS26_CIOSA